MRDYPLGGHGIARIQANRSQTAFRSPVVQSLIWSTQVRING
jgi:hypothetical protein